MLTRLVKDCKSLLQSGFIFQQDGAPAHKAKLVQNWIAITCYDFIGKEPPNSPDLNLLNFHVSFDFNTGTIMKIVIFILIVLRGIVVV